ncbi:MAG: glutamate racemase [Desulfuromonadales bacterium]|nr:glutamate racemase [Desulfuromonadales bacterium]
MSSKAIGLFDSGVGGLTVLKEVIALLPYEDTIYFGDTARVPYGTKSSETVIRFAKEITSFLINRDIKLLVVACNTASAVSLDELQTEFSIPIVGVIDPGARRAASVTKTGHVGVIGTEGTIRSSAYTKAIKRINPDIDVIATPCPMFVPLAEEGWLDNEITKLTAETYLKGLKAQGIDTLVLGCTHYPLLKGIIGEVMGNDVKLVDSAEETAFTVSGILKDQRILKDSNRQGNHHYFVTDVPAGFVKVGNRFLGSSIMDVCQVNLED